MAKAKILLVEDDQSLAFVVKDNLEHEGYEVHCYSDGIGGWQGFSLNDFDLCLLDVMLPKLDGFTLGAKIRHQNADIPILYLTAKAMQEDKLKGFKSGGDDYITKPFSVEELTFRIEVFLRRKFSNNTDNQWVEMGSYKFSLSLLLLKHNNEDQQLTLKEANVLHYLWQHKDQAVRREDILQKIWGNDDYFLGRSLDVYISKLRKHLNKDNQIEIKNIHGVGFMLSLNKN